MYAVANRHLLSTVGIFPVRARRAGMLNGASPNEIKGLTDWLASLERNVEHGDTLAGDEARALAKTLSVSPIRERTPKRWGRVARS